MKIMASGLITSWQIDGEKVETVTDFIFLGSKIAAEDKVTANTSPSSPSPKVPVNKVPWN